MTLQQTAPKEPHLGALALWQDRLPLGTYRHFKGTLYRLLSLGLSSETTEVLCIYQKADGTGPVWVRPVSMWTEAVDRSGYSGPRFYPAED